MRPISPAPRSLSLCLPVALVMALTTPPPRARAEQPGEIQKQVEATLAEVVTNLKWGSGFTALRNLQAAERTATALPAAFRAQVADFHAGVALEIGFLDRALERAEAGLGLAAGLAPPAGNIRFSLLAKLAQARHALFDPTGALETLHERQAALEALAPRDHPEVLENLLRIWKLEARLGLPGAADRAARLASGPPDSEPVRRFKALADAALPLRPIAALGGSRLLADARGRPLSSFYSTLEPLPGGGFRAVEGNAWILLDARGLAIVPGGAKTLVAARDRPDRFLVGHRTWPDEPGEATPASLQGGTTLYGILDGSGRLVVPREFPGLLLRSDGWSWGTDAASQPVWFDADGKPVEEAAFRAAAPPDTPSRAWPAGYRVQRGERGTVSLVGPGDKVLVPFEAGIEVLHPYQEGVAPARKGGLWGLLDMAGAWRVPPGWQDIGVDAYSEGRMAVKLAGDGVVPGREWTWVDPQGKALGPGRYAFLQKFEKGQAWARVPADPARLLGIGEGTGTPEEVVDARDRQVDGAGKPTDPASAIPGFAGELVVHLSDRGWSISAFAPGELALEKPARRFGATGVAPRYPHQAMIRTLVVPKVPGMAPGSGGPRVTALLQTKATLAAPQAGLVLGDPLVLTRGGRKWQRRVLANPQRTDTPVFALGVLEGKDRIYGVSLAGMGGDKALVLGCFDRLLDHLELPFEPKT